MYNAVLQKPPPNIDQLCSCVTDEKKNGIIQRLNWYASFFRGNENLERMSKISTTPRKFTKDLRIVWPLFGESKERAIKSNATELPRLHTPDAWKMWRAELEESMQREEIYNLSIYLYCKIKQSNVTKNSS